MSGYIRQSSGLIINGATIQDSHFNNEFNALADAFNGTTGHAHSGGAGDAPLITATGLASNAITTVKITDANVTYAKIQNVSATDKLLGRSTAGAGVIEEISCNALGRTILNTNAAGIRTAIGTVIGTDVQAYDPQLAALAAQTWDVYYVPLFLGATTVDKIYVDPFMQTGLSISSAPFWRFYTSSAASTQEFEWSGFLSYPTDKSYTLVLKAPFDGEITETVTKCATGTATATFKIDTTALGGTPNAVSSSEVAVNQSTDNEFSAGQSIVLTISSASSIGDMAFTIKYTRVLEE